MRPYKTVLNNVNMCSNSYNLQVPAFIIRQKIPRAVEPVPRPGDVTGCSEKVTQERKNCDYLLSMIHVTLTL